jgi:hypothetical protein
MTKLAEHAPAPKKHHSESPGSEEPGTLASYLQKSKAGKNQVKRFLATAHWLQLKGSKNLKTGDVSKALKDHHQSKLTNASDCLNQNVTKGFCEKDGDGFYVTPDGLDSLR